VHHITQGLIFGVPVDAPLYPAWTKLICFGQPVTTPEIGEKRGRGRPRKISESTTPKPASEGPKRGRGRPRKSVAEAEPEVVTPSAAKRGRGRPRKEPGMVFSLICSRMHKLTLKFGFRICYSHKPSDQE
jgi:hypothetical protein